MSALSASRNATDAQLPVFKPLLPPSRQVPQHWQGQHCVALPAAAALAELDYAAVMASRAQLQGLFAADDPWPPADLTLADDRADLAWHATEFQQGKSFAYSLLSHDRSRCLGCLYLYPTASPAHGGEAYLWTRTTEPEPLRQAIEAEVITWLANDWPLQNLAWPGRSMPFNQWPYANYYSVKR
ncbi:MAG: hypothetical protein EA348_12920 [Pseudomonadaceae bacterium]|nr:MAG: hypothetical protein EA348_12920 [Pseudomonadaceae bacterium]